ncbi:MAG: DUF1385 domain-containing protein [Chloroflexia bacterium]
MSRFHYGGQALLEGVMIRGRSHMVAAVRAPSGEIVYYEEPLPPAARSLARWPFLRGLYSLWDTLWLGVRALTFSANVAVGDPQVQIGSGGVVGVLVLALAFGIGLFFVLPLLLSRLVEPVVVAPWARTLLEGLIRLGILLLYLVLIGQLPDLKRVFAYHGAEHKAVNAYECGAPLDVEAIRPFSTAHARCGTAFLLLVVVLCVLVFAPFGALPFGLRLVSRVLLVPVVAALAYETMRLGAGHAERPFVRMLLAPALFLQHLTTRPPDDGMLEVALSALRRALELDATEGVTAR